MVQLELPFRVARYFGSSTNPQYFLVNFAVGLESGIAFLSFNLSCTAFQLTLKNKSVHMSGESDATDLDSFTHP